MADKKSGDFKAWLARMGFNDSSVSKLMEEDFISPRQLADLEKEDIKYLRLTMAQRKILERVVAELKSSAERPGNQATVSDPARNEDRNDLDLPSLNTIVQKQNRTTNAVISCTPDFTVQEMKLTGIEGGEVNTLNVVGIVRGDVGCKHSTVSRDSSVKDENTRKPLPQGAVPKKMKETRLENMNVMAVKNGRADTAVAAGIIYGDVNVYGTAQKTKKSNTRIPDTLRHRMEHATRIFEKTQAYERVFKILRDHSHIVISGSPGSGKTTMSLFLMSEYLQKNYSLRNEKNIKEFSLENVDLQRDTLLVFDDVFGSFSLTQDAHLHYRSLFKAIEDYFTNIKFKLLDKQRENEDQQNTSFRVPNYSLKVIFCTRTNILHDVFPRIKKFKGNLFHPNTIFDLSTMAKLDQEEKKRILHKHLTNHNVSLRPDYIDVIANKEYATLGFPFICQLFVEDDRYCKNPVDFFERPLHYLDIYISEMFEDENSKDTAAVMLFTMLKDGELDLSRDTDVVNYSKEEADALFNKLNEVIPELERGSFLQKLRRHAENQVGTLLIKEGDLAKFCHPTIHDAVGFVVGSKNPCFVLRNCSLKFIIERVRIADEPEKEFSTGDAYDFMIKINRQSVNILIDRLAKEMSKGNLALALSHYCLREAENAKHLLTFISVKGNMFDILHSSDSDHGLCFLFWVAFTANNALCSLVFRDTQCDNTEQLADVKFDEQEISEAVLGTCMSGNHEGLGILLKHCDRCLTVKINSASLGDILQKDTETKYAYRQIASTYSKDSTAVSVDLDIPRMHGEKRDKLIHISAANGYTDIVTTLIGVGVDIDSIGGTNMTPLMYACYLGHKELVESLLQMGANFKLLDEEDDNCLHLASRAGFTDIAEILLKTGIDINTRGCRDRTPLMFASYGKLNVVKCLLEKGALAEPDNSHVKYKDNCLHIAARGVQTDVVQVLIEEGRMNMEAGGELDRTPLMVACRHGRLENAQYLLSNGANHRALDVYGFSCLHLAAMGGHNSTITWLLESLNWDTVDCNNVFKRTPLMYALQFGHRDIVDLLLQNGADKTLKDEGGNACIHFAAISRDYLNIQLCLNFGQGVNCRNDNGRTPLMNTLHSGHPETVELLLQNGADKTLKDKNGNACIHFAVRSGVVSVVRLCLEFGQDINYRNDEGFTPLSNACHCGDIPMIRFLLDMKADPTLTNNKGRSCSHSACYGGHKEVVKVLQECQIFDISSPDRFGISPLVTAVKFDKADVVEYLLLIEPSLISHLNNRGQNALHVACRFGAVNTAARLIKAGIAVNAQDKDKMTPLMYAVCHKKDIVNVVTLLLENDADSKLRNKFRETCLHAAINRAGHISMTKYLLDMGMDINIRGVCGETPIMLACRKSAHVCFDLLLKKGADVTLVDNNRATPLHVACLTAADHTGIVLELLKKDRASVNRTDMCGRTPVMHAVRMRRMQTLKVLISNDANLETLDKFGSSVLHIACGYEPVSFSIVKLLVRNVTRVNINSRDRYGLTPVMLAARNGHDAVIEILVVKGADLSMVDAQNMNPIDHAERNGHHHVTERLRLTLPQCPVTI